MSKRPSAANARPSRKPETAGRLRFGNADIAIVDLAEGGYGWRVTSKAGKPMKLRFGHIHRPQDPEDAAKYSKSLKMIDNALRAVTSGKRPGSGGQGPKYRNLMSGALDGKRSAGRNGQAGRRSDRD